MRIGFAMTYSGGFSGGRLHAFLLAAELASQGHEVTVVANQPLGFVEKLPPVPGRDLVRFEKLKFDLLRPPRTRAFDLWFVVQERSLNGRFFAPVFEHARREGVPIVLLTFETPNWQAAMLPTFKGAWMDALIEEPVRLGAQVLSSTEEGRQWARRHFFETAPENFHVLSPPVTAAYHAEPVERDAKLILAFTRRASPHKGYDAIMRLLNPRLRGWKVILVDGFGVSFEAGSYAAYKREHDGLDISVRTNISDEEKYRLIKSARLLLYPSSFEGFGLPPGEARYWGTPVVCYDLPVLREVYGDSLRYVQAGDLAAFEEVVHEELAKTPDFTPAREARRVGSFDRWREDVRATMEQVMGRATPPEPLPSVSVGAAVPIVVVDQLSNWNKEDSAASAGSELAECEVVSFDRELFAQRKLERDRQMMFGNETLLPSGDQADDLRGRLLNAVEKVSSRWVFLTEDLIVCPRETIVAAMEEAEVAGAEAAAIPVRPHFQSDGPRHYRTCNGELLAACGVFRRDFLLESLRTTNQPGCRSQPVIDTSYLLLSRGGKVVSAADKADLLPPRTAPIDFDCLPGGIGTWQEIYRDARGDGRLMDPIPCRNADDDRELEFNLHFREQVAVLLAQHADSVVRRGLVAELLKSLLSSSRLWREVFDHNALLYSLFRLDGGYLAFGRLFMARGHFQTFLRCVLVANWNGDLDPLGPEVYHPFARNLLGRVDQMAVID